MKLFGTKLVFAKDFLTFIFILLSLTVLFNINDPEKIKDSFFSVLSIIFILYGSVIIHEYAHAFVARIFGYPCKLIEMHIFGGFAYIFSPFEKFREEFYIIIAGPVSNIILAFLCWPFIDYHVIFAWVVTINFNLAVFNLLPLFPMDGGRIFRSIGLAAGLKPLTACRYTFLAACFITLPMIVYFSFEFNLIGLFIVLYMFMNTKLAYEDYKITFNKNEELKSIALEIIDNKGVPSSFPLTPEKWSKILPSDHNIAKDLANASDEELEELRFQTSLIFDFIFVLNNCVAPDASNKLIIKKIEQECKENVDVFCFKYSQEIQKYKDSRNYWDLINLAESRLKGLKNELFQQVC